MNSKFSFNLVSNDRSRPLPNKLVLGRQESETTADVLLKLLGFLLFFRDRLQVDSNLHNDNIPFIPPLAQLDYEMRPRLWIETGGCSPARLDKLAVKVPEAEIWILTRSAAAAANLLDAMQHEELRTQRYRVIGFDGEMFNELCGLLQSRNTVTWFRGTFNPPQLQFEFNGLWFDAPFNAERF